MILVDQNPNLRAELAAEVGRVLAYLADLEGLQIGSYPSWRDWGAGQRIIGAERVTRPVTVLRGRAADRREIETGPVQVISLEKRWARTTSGLYRLVPEGEA